MVEEEPWGHDDSYKDTAHIAEEEEERPEEEFVEDMDTAVALTAMAECDDNETDVTEELGDAAQYQLIAFVAVDQAKTKAKVVAKREVKEMARESTCSEHSRVRKTELHDLPS